VQQSSIYIFAEDFFLHSIVPIPNAPALPMGRRWLYSTDKYYSSGSKGLRMAFDTTALFDALNSVISIPLIPYNGDTIDFEGHRKNIGYLMENNYLSDNRPRVISLAGTSLIHHVDFDDHVRLVDVAGQQMGADGVLMAAIVPNPIGTAGELVKALSQLQRPPDVYLIMPLGGTYSPEGLYSGFMRFGEKYGNECGARFLYYFRTRRDCDAVIRLLNDSPHFIGVKIGTSESDVPTFVEAVGGENAVIWGIGDRSTGAAELGATGHTSGINIVVARASDEINNAQRRGDYDTARAIESIIAPLEDIRFMNDRAYNYSAVMETIIRAGFEDVCAGTGGPFNPRLPDDLLPTIDAIVAAVKDYH
jgi:dihydrodipicolinate synthase/N-acetylneuraminate lyase